MTARAARLRLGTWLVLSAALCGFAACRDRGPAPAPATDDAPRAAPVRSDGTFRDMTAGSGVSFTYRNGEETDHYAILEAIGGGVALLDYDGDGLLDVFVTGGGYFDGARVRGHPCRLYKNLGNWHFRDVTHEAGLDRPLFYTHGCAVADYDRDGWPDLLVTGYGRLALFHNVGDGHGGRRFVEVSRQVGLDDDRWSTSAAWADLDGDGYPDLYVCHYVDWSLDHSPECSAADGRRDVCTPKSFAPLAHTLYHNDGGRRFRDVSAGAGLRRDGKGLGVVVVDANGDRRPDVYVANDTTDNFLYWNRGGGKLQEQGLSSGVARDYWGAANGSMGVDTSDYDGSGRPALWVTNYEHELHALYRNEGKEVFTYRTQAAGIGALGQQFVGFGTGFLDVDNDGWEDLFIANGHAVRFPSSGQRAQRAVLLRNRGDGRFTDDSAAGGPYFAGTHTGRGVAIGDLDNDGRADLVISHLNEPVVLLRNESPREPGGTPHWLGVELAGRKDRDVAGATLIVEVNGRRLTRFAKGGGSYLSANDRRLLFGLGKAARVERLTVMWPWGREQHWSGDQLAVDRYWRLAEGETAPQATGPRKTGPGGRR